MDKQIEEMSKVIRQILKERTDICYIPDLGKPIAEELYNADYRKIPKNAVVLTRERYEELEKAVDSVQVAVSSFTRLETLYKIKCKELEIAEAKTRKETAKEILQGLNKWLNGAIRESYNQSVNGVVFQGGKNRAFHEVKDLVKKVAESKGVEVE